MAYQIPIWVKVGARQALFASWEREAKATKRLRAGEASFERAEAKLPNLVATEEMELKRLKDSSK